MTWRDRAACLDEDPELFFPIGNTEPAFRQIEEARAVCLRCEVMSGPNDTSCLSQWLSSRVRTRSAVLRLDPHDDVAVSVQHSRDVHPVAVVGEGWRPLKAAVVRRFDIALGVAAFAPAWAGASRGAVDGGHTSGVSPPAQPRSRMGKLLLSRGAVRGGVTEMLGMPATVLRAGPTGPAFVAALF